MGLSNPYQIPVAAARESDRASFLRQVGAWTFLGLLTAGATSLVSTGAVLWFEPLQNTWVSFGVMMGAMFGSRAIGSSMVYSDAPTTRLLGFLGGTALQGVAMGYLLLAAILMSYELYANPMIMMGQALALVGLTVTGMVAYLLTGPKNLSLVGGALAALSLPMLGLMVMSFVFPIGGVFGMLISALFVVMSAGGLLFNLNEVLHRNSTDQVVPAAYHVSLGILVLFWNVLSLLMRLQRR